MASPASSLVVQYTLLTCCHHKHNSVKTSTPSFLPLTSENRKQIPTSTFVVLKRSFMLVQVELLICYPINYGMLKWEQAQLFFQVCSYKSSAQLASTRSFFSLSPYPLQQNFPTYISFYIGIDRYYVRNIRVVIELIGITLVVYLRLLFHDLEILASSATHVLVVNVLQLRCFGMECFYKIILMEQGHGC